MTIECIRFEKGIPFEDLGDSLADGLKRVIESNRARAEVLPEGNHCFNAPWWKSPEHNHSLMVLEDGTGVYRRTPKAEGARLRILRRRGVETKAGGVQYHIPADYKRVVVGGELPDESQGIYAVIFYSPGPSLKK